MKIQTAQNTSFDRDSMLTKLSDTTMWDIIIIGGGATGLGTAVDAAARGYKTLLLEQSDFGKGTSSRSTKLVHGGVRYLAQGDIGLVYEALRERGLLLKNAPHLVKPQDFIIPCYDLKSCIMYLAGLKLYDWLAGRFSFGRSKFMSVSEVKRAIPGIREQKLMGGVRYYDGQFDDSRLAINLAQTSAEQGGLLLNYMKVSSLIKAANGKVAGVEAVDLENGKNYRLNARVVINATGVFVDDILAMDSSASKPTVRPSQGAHLLLDKSFLNGDSAMMIPKTADGRVLFAVPWHGFALLGTTDTPLNEKSLEPVALDKEVDFILRTAGQYLERKPLKKDVLSVFAGLRPLAAPGKDINSTKEISRSHKLMVSATGLVTITGGKWTTYRKMAEDTVDRAIRVGGLSKAACPTRDLKIHGHKVLRSADALGVYGADETEIRRIIQENPEWNLRLVERVPYIQAEVIWAARKEMARTVEDVLARRLRLLFLDARAAIEAAPVVARLLALELGRSAEWQKAELTAFTGLAGNYLLESAETSRLNPDSSVAEL